MNENRFMKSSGIGVALIFIGILAAGCVSSNSDISNKDVSAGKCQTSVTFKYVNPEYKVENHKNLQKFTKRNLTGGQKLGGQTRFSGLTWTVKNVKRGCGVEKQVTVRHRGPIRVLMPEKGSMLSCNYNTILKHEMEHVAIYRDTPREYDKKFRSIARKGGNVDGQFARLAREISVEMKRRNDSFHDKDGAVLKLKNRCASTAGYS